MALENLKQSIDSCLESFRYDIPRGELCCHLGRVFCNKVNTLKQYIGTMRIDGPRPKDSPFVREECHTWLPHIQLCICYDRIKEYEKAIYHNEEVQSSYLIIQVLNIIENILIVYSKIVFDNHFGREEFVSCSQV